MLHYKPRLRSGTSVSQWVPTPDARNRGFVLGGGSLYGTCRSIYPWTTDGFDPNDNTLWNSFPGTYYGPSDTVNGFILDSGYIRTVVASGTWNAVNQFAGLGINRTSALSQYGLQTDVTGSSNYGTVDHQYPGTPYCRTSLLLHSGTNKWALQLGYYSQIYYQYVLYDAAKVLNPEYKVTQTRFRARATVTDSSGTTTLGRIAVEIFESTTSPFLNISVTFVPAFYFDQMYITHGIDPDVGSSLPSPNYWSADTFNYLGCEKTKSIKQPYGLKKVTAQAPSYYNGDPTRQYNLTLISKDSEFYSNKVKINSLWPVIYIDDLWNQNDLLYQATDDDDALEGIAYFIGAPANQMKTAVFGYQFGANI